MFTALKLKKEAVFTSYIKWTYGYLSYLMVYVPMSLALRMISENCKVFGYDICCMTPRYDVQHIGCQFVARSVLEVMSGIAKRKKAASSH